MKHSTQSTEEKCNSTKQEDGFKFPSSGKRKVVTVQFDDLGLAGALAMHMLFERIASKHGFDDIFEVQCNLVMSATSFAGYGEATLEAFKAELKNLRIDANVSEVRLFGLDDEQ
jgi:hypothetical protein